MVQRVEVRLIDDLSGELIRAGKGETVAFSLDGKSYEVDLTAENANLLRKVLQPYIEAGRPVTDHVDGGAHGGLEDAVRAERRPRSVRHAVAHPPAERAGQLVSGCLGLLAGDRAGLDANIDSLRSHRAHADARGSMAGGSCPSSSTSLANSGECTAWTFGRRSCGRVPDSVGCRRLRCTT
jgi:nucleoid-associated protein Lsr2